VLASACATPLPTPEQPGAEDAYRAALLYDARRPRAREARERLEALAWDSARAEHTVFAYRRFLKEFEDSRHASEARQLLEGLRWMAAERDGSEPALAGYLEDEPRGAHAAQAWARVSSLRLGSALESGQVEPLRAWLAENPSSPGRDKAQAALDDLDFRAAADAAGWRRYLDAHLDGAHRAEAQAKLDRTLIEEAALLEDEAKLRALGDPAADRIAWDRAAALLDEGRLAQLARRPGPHAAEAARDLAALSKHPRKAALLEAAAHKLYLPRATLDGLPEDAPARAALLREWARALDGARLHRMLAELTSTRAGVALAALDGAEQLLQGLPLAEARVRAGRELSALQPLAVDAPQLTALAVLQLASGRDDKALESARAAVARNPRCAPAVWLAARLETEPALQQIALQTLRAQGRELAAAHASAARAGDPAALSESCAALRAATRAAQSIAEAQPEALVIERQIEEGIRSQRQSASANANPNPNPNATTNATPTPTTTASTNPSTSASSFCESAAPSLADERLAAARYLISSGSKLARPPLARAAARDPDPRIRAAIHAAVALDLR